MSCIKPYASIAVLSMFMTFGNCAPDRTPSQNNKPSETSSTSNTNAANISTANNNEMLKKINSIDVQTQKIATDMAEIKTLKKDIEELRTQVNNITQIVKQNQTSIAQLIKSTQPIVAMINAKIARNKLNSTAKTVSNLQQQVVNKNIGAVQNVVGTITPAKLAQVRQGVAKNLANKVVTNTLKLKDTGAIADVAKMKNVVNDVVDGSIVPNGLQN